MTINYLNITPYTVTFTWDYPLKDSLDKEFTVSIKGDGKEYNRYVTGRNAVTISGLEPGTSYEGTVEGAGTVWSIDFFTQEGSSLNPLAFGALGDGIHDDTLAFQAAIACLPKEGILRVTSGTYRVKPLFLKSNMTLVLEKEAHLMAEKDPSFYPMIPKMEEGRILGTWEGLESTIYASVITAVGCENLTIAGEGIIDGNADITNWWHSPKNTVPAARGRLVFLNQCRKVTMAGVTLQNSPSWTLHPFCSNELLFADLKIKNPDDSPNTDGLDPEFCQDVVLHSIHFSVGDDCIAIKAGKKELADHIRLCTKNVTIENCLMERGHGAVVLGSEMSGGIENVHVKDCVFLDTDRGIRLKTRRGRGGAVKDIHCESVYMRNIGSAFVFNMFYFCDADGKTPPVQNKEALPLNEGTPELCNVHLENIEIDDLRNCFLFMYGLPERWVNNVKLKGIKATAAQNPEPEFAAMMCDIDPMVHQGLFLRNVKDLEMEDLQIDGFEKDLKGIDNVKLDGNGIAI